MAQPEIIDKLNDFLKLHEPLSEECHVVYAMVEARKILDHHEAAGNPPAFPLLRFYCDWTLHTEKTRITPEIRSIMSDVSRSLREHLANPVMRPAESVIRFMYMNELRDEVKDFLAAQGLNPVLVEDDDWIQFVSLLVKVLANQPIQRPTDDIDWVSFVPAAPRCVEVVVRFRQAINGQHEFRLGNAY